jgi:hypothetical protein
MNVQVDESGRDDKAAGVEHFCAGVARQIPDRLDPAIFDQQVADLVELL